MRVELLLRRPLRVLFVACELGNRACGVGVVPHSIGCCTLCWVVRGWGEGCSALCVLVLVFVLVVGVAVSISS